MLLRCWAGSSVGTSVRLKSGRSAVRPRPCPPPEPQVRDSLACGFPLLRTGGATANPVAPEQGRWLNGEVADLQGAYDEQFADVARALTKALDEGDAGGSAAVFVDGEPVVDLWGGHADAGRTRPWERDTIVNVFSVTKTMTALCALVLVDRGLLDPDAPVAQYWPEFATAGKGGVLVRHVLSHTAGLPDWTGPVDELYDWTAATRRL